MYKRSVSITFVSILSFLLMLGVTQIAFADVTNNVDVETNTGGNTICQNGKCTTTSNDGQSKCSVTVNGKQYPCNNGNVDVQDDGTHVKVNSNSGSSSVNVNNNSNSDTTTPESSENDIPTVTDKSTEKPQVSPTENKDEKKKVEKKEMKLQHLTKGLFQRMWDMLSSLFKNSKI